MAKSPAYITARLERLLPCYEATKWLGRRTSPERAWRACRRGDWLLWVASRLNVDRKLLALATCDCATLALEYVPDGEERPRLAIEAARAWANGDGSVSLDDVRDAARAARAAAYAAHAYATATATHAANAAHAAAYAAAYATSAAIHAHAAAAHAANAAAYAATAEAEMRAKCAALVRKQIPWETIKAALVKAKL